MIADRLRFIGRLIARPSQIGAVAPSSAALGRAMAAQIPDSAGPILELGPGTGVVTAAILARGIAPERLTAIEYDPDFSALMSQRFPRVRVVRGNAFDLAGTLGDMPPFAAVLSSLPLINFPLEMRLSLLKQVFERLVTDAPFIQFSYRIKPPVPPPDAITVTRAARILLNIPPARVWVYRKTDQRKRGPE
jgi:phosphatidylethanolamine/phosphatidyl-N-methylethanolamine N-methyltransferase